MKFPVRMVGKHGAMHAYSTSEVAHLQSLGWSVERLAEEVPKEALAESMRLDPPVSEIGGIGGSRAIPASPDSFEVPPPIKRKPGRPPKAK